MATQTTGTDRNTGQSTNIASVHYYPAMQELQIDFHSGESHLYYGVPSDVYDALMSAESMDGYYVHNVRDRFRVELMG